ncbi:MAG: hypothetical protein ACOC1W_04695, partial [Bacillota bacterium]
KTKLSIIIIFLLLAVTGPAVQSAQYSPVNYEGLPEGVYTQITPEVELLAGVLSQTTWIERRGVGPKRNGNYYFQKLQNFFKDYQGHQAVKIAQRF